MASAVQRVRTNYAELSVILTDIGCPAAKIFQRSPSLQASRPCAADEAAVVLVGHDTHGGECLEGTTAQTFRKTGRAGQVFNLNGVAGTQPEDELLKAVEPGLDPPTISHIHLSEQRRCRRRHLQELTNYSSRARQQRPENPRK